MTFGQMRCGHRSRSASTTTSGFQGTGPTSIRRTTSEIIRAMASSSTEGKRANTSTNCCLVAVQAGPSSRTTSAREVRELSSMTRLARSIRLGPEGEGDGRRGKPWRRVKKFWGGRELRPTRRVGRPRSTAKGTYYNRAYDVIKIKAWEKGRAMKKAKNVMRKVMRRVLRLQRLFYNNKRYHEYVK